jgi:hypothetical protein
MNIAPCKKGDKIRMKHMEDPRPIPSGTIGEVLEVRELPKDGWQLHMRWENGRTLSLIYPHDTFELVS